MRTRILNSQFDILTLEQTTDAIFQRIAQKKRGWLCTVNVAILMMMRANPQLQNFIDRAALIVADGQPLIWCSPWLDKKLPERVTGIDLIDAICARAERENQTIFMLGASDAIIRRSAEKIQEKHPGLKLEVADGYFNSEQARQRAAVIKASGASILLVGMGVPRQEQFIDAQWDNLGVTIAIPVGGSFDVIAGLRTRAPLWVQRIGMEWSWRLVQDPKRLFKRYLVTNGQFIFYIARALLSKLIQPSRPR